MNSDRIEQELKEIVEEYWTDHPDVGVSVPPLLSLRVRGPFEHLDGLNRWHRRLCRELGLSLPRVVVQVSTHLPLQAWQFFLTRPHCSQSGELTPALTAHWATENP